MNKDWIGNKATTFVQLGASNHTEREREINDYYATDPNTLRLFLNKLKKDNIILNKEIWECACGEGHLSKVLQEYNYNVYSTDIIDRGYGDGIINFLNYHKNTNKDILTNPPYKYAKEFVEHALEIIGENNYVIMLLKIQFLEGKARNKMFKKYPPKFIYVFSSRQTCYLNGDMRKKLSSASCYCWYIWQKGNKTEPIIRWIE